LITSFDYWTSPISTDARCRTCSKRRDKFQEASRDEQVAACLGAKVRTLLICVAYAHQRPLICCVEAMAQAPRQPTDLKGVGALQLRRCQGVVQWWAFDKAATLVHRTSPFSIRSVLFCCLLKSHFEPLFRYRLRPKSFFGNFADLRNQV